MNLSTLFALTATLMSNLAFAVSDDLKPFDPSRLKLTGAAQANEVLVLGTPHLSSLPEQFKPASLGLLMDRLASWNPQIITIEALSGTQCHYLRTYPVRYADTIKSYCWDPAPARAATGLDVPAATVEAERLLAAWPATPTPAQRRHLAAVLLAAGEQASALVQWLRLPEGEQKSADGLDQNLVQRLQNLSQKRNEDYQIAAVLAARLGLERVVAADDHTSDTAPLNEVDDQVATEVMLSVWNNPASARRKAEGAKLYQQLATADGVLAMYRAFNQPDQALLAYQSDFGAALYDRSPQQIGRTYVTYWETRNLRMVSHIREALGSAPGKRVLSIVGASHKGYFEAYLSMMHDVNVISSDKVLQ